MAYRVVHGKLLKWQMRKKFLIQKYKGGKIDYSKANYCFHCGLLYFDKTLNRCFDCGHVLRSNPRKHHVGVEYFRY